MLIGAGIGGLLTVGGWKWWVSLGITGVGLLLLTIAIMAKPKKKPPPQPSLPAIRMTDSTANIHDNEAKLAGGPFIESIRSRFTAARNRIDQRGVGGEGAPESSDGRRSWVMPDMPWKKKPPGDSKH